MIKEVSSSLNILSKSEKSSKLVNEISYTKFESSVDIDVRLGVDPKKANQMVRGVVSLPHGTGKTVRVLALVPADKEAEAKEAGADFVGLDEYITKIEGGWVDVDIIITMPAVMAKLGKLGRVLGPRNLMPNPKSGTVTTDVAIANSSNEKPSMSAFISEEMIECLNWKFVKTHCSNDAVASIERKMQQNFVLRWSFQGAN
jgi:ribosomal protein L1